MHGTTKPVLSPWEDGPESLKTLEQLDIISVLENFHPKKLRLALWYHVVGDGVVGAVGLVDGAESLLVLLDVAIEGHKKAFSVDGRHDDALAHRGTLTAGESLREIDNKLGGRMGDDSEVAVGSLRHLVADVDVQILLLFFLCHRLDIKVKKFESLTV